MLPIYHPRFRSAMKLIDEAQYAEAARQVNELASELSGTDRASALYWKGVCLAGLGRIDDAMTCVHDALAEVGPDSGLGVCLQLLMASYLQRNEQREARIAAIRSLLSRYARRFSTPDFLWLHVDAKSAVGRTLLRLGKYSEGTAELEQALSMEPRPAARYRARVWLQSAYYKSGDLNKAKEHLENALKDADSAAKHQLPVDHPAQVRYELALIAYKQHRLADAQRELALASAVAQNPKTLRAVSKLRELLDQPQ